MPKDTNVPESQHVITQQLRLARAYVPPIQMFSTRLEPMEGLMRGTIFPPELYMPYKPWKGPRGGNES